MANIRYYKANQKLGRGQIALETADIRVLGVTSAYVLDLTHEFVSDLGATILARSVQLTSAAVDATGAFDAANATLVAVPNGQTIAYLILFKSTGVDATSPLIGYMDTGINLPYLGTGADQLVQWSDGPNKIMKI